MPNRSRAGFVSRELADLISLVKERGAALLDLKRFALLTTISHPERRFSGEVESLLGNSVAARRGASRFHSAGPARGGEPPLRGVKVSLLWRDRWPRVSSGSDSGIFGSTGASHSGLLGERALQRLVHLGDRDEIFIPNKLGKVDPLHPSDGHTSVAVDSPARPP